MSAFHFVSLGALNHRQTINKLYFMSWFEHRYSFCLCIVLLVKDKSRTFAPLETKRIKEDVSLLWCEKKWCSFWFLFFSLRLLYSSKRIQLLKSLTIEISKLIPNSTWIFRRSTVGNNNGNNCDTFAGANEWNGKMRKTRIILEDIRAQCAS